MAKQFTLVVVLKREVGSMQPRAMLEVPCHWRIDLFAMAICLLVPACLGGMCGAPASIGISGQVLDADPLLNEEVETFLVLTGTTASARARVLL